MSRFIRRSFILLPLMVLFVMAGFGYVIADSSGLSLTAVNYEGTYDGRTQFGGADVSIEEAVVSYSIDGGQSWSETAPSISNAGSLTYQAKAELTGYETVYAEGTLTINPVDVTVKIIGKQSTVVYDGRKHTVVGYDAISGSDLYQEDDFVFSGTAAAARNTTGRTYMELASDQFTNQNNNFHVVFDVEDGYQEITAIDEVVVRVTGHMSSVIFDGSEHRVRGYDLEISNPLYSEMYIDFIGSDEARRTDVGVSYMGLSEDSFINNNGKFSKVIFKVTDGFQEILPVVETSVKTIIRSEQEDLGIGAPSDLESHNLPLIAVIRNDSEEFESEALSVDTRLLVQNPNLEVHFIFKQILPWLGSGNYSVEIYGLPESINGTDSPQWMDPSLKNKYYLIYDAWINERGYVDLNLLWEPERYAPNPLEEADHSLPEDAVGAYSIGPDGEKEYVIFQTHEICMSYLGDAELCSSGERTFNK